MVRRALSKHEQSTSVISVNFPENMLSSSSVCVIVLLLNFLSGTLQLLAQTMKWSSRIQKRRLSDTSDLFGSGTLSKRDKTHFMLNMDGKLECKNASQIHVHLATRIVDWLLF